MQLIVIDTQLDIPVLEVETGAPTLYEMMDILCEEISMLAVEPTFTR